jgi:hypothetical protein
MKRCPSCDRTYPDAELFCETDGTALVGTEPAFAQGRGGAAAEQATECPVCGGKAQPGEVICNFCGARLSNDEPAAAVPPPSQPVRPPVTVAPRRVQPATSRTQQPPSQRLTGQMPADEPAAPEESSGRSILSIIGYLLAAVIALAGGAWLALHLSNGTKVASQPTPAAVTSAAAPAAAGPIVALASTIPIQSSDTASLAQRSPDAARQVFDTNQKPLLDTYSHALIGDPTVSDGMIVRVVVQPTDGSVASTSIVTSTAPNPGLDAEVAKLIAGWTFPSATGAQVQFDYPVIFAQNAADQASIEAQLKTKLASLNSAEPAEYTAATPGAPVAGGSPAAAPSSATGGGLGGVPGGPPAAPVAPPTAPIAVETPAPPVAPAATPRHRRKIARPAPTPTLQQRVKDELLSNPKLRRVDCYTSGGTVTIFGKVFDANAKLLAERTVQNVPGVTNVIDSLSTDTDDWAARQAQIAQQLYNAGLNKVTIKVIGHDAYLGGSVKSDADKDRAVTITESAAPVHVRTNLIMVEPGSVFGF